MIKFNEWPIEKVEAVKVDYLYEASIALSTREDQRGFFIKDPTKFATTKEELEVKYQAYDQFVNQVWAKVDSLLAGDDELKSYFHLKVTNSTEMEFFPGLIMSMGESGTAWGDAVQYPDEETLAEKLTLSWHRTLLEFSDEDNEAFGTDNGTDEAFLRIEERMKTTDFTDFAQIVEFIMNSQHDGEVKIKLIQLHRDEARIFRAAAKVLLELAPAIEALGRPVRPAMKEMRDIAASPSRWQSLLDIIAPTIDASLAEHATIHLRPQLMWPHAIGLFYPRMGHLHLAIGIYTLELMERTDIVSDRFNKIIERTKLLSDPSRLKIVMLLQSRPMYLKELADQLGLSSATLSHHVQNMVNQQLLRVEISQDSRRVYYSLNQASFTELGQLISALGTEN